MDHIIDNYRFLKIAVLLISVSHLSCDQVEIKFPDYGSAEKAGIFNQGWIPEKLLSNSMTNIYQRTNLDLNTYIFSYNISETDLHGTLAIVQKTNQKILPKRIKIPDWWFNKVTTLNHYTIFDSKTHDSIYIAVDKQDLRVFGWCNGLTNKTKR